ncbi:MAG TPA: phytanoyl-CoA dioxygenase family protein [Planctomycetota bacterium]|nr:phytanoyl-CoA dioxygenase family protein [Planctomycetota bacterium]
MPAHSVSEMSKVNSSVLSRSQIEEFIERGFTIVRDAFSRKTAEQVRARIWEEIHLSPDDPSGWTKATVHLKKNLEGAPFSDVFTPRVYGAFDDVMGPERWKRTTHLGWWPVAFPGFDSPPWTVPTEGWHIDGSFFHHHLTSPEQGLLPIFLFSDIGPGDGGTALSEGSHEITARILADAEPIGHSMDELSARVLAHPRSRASVIEATGNAGDVVLIHPFLLHARSPNTGNKVRFICNPAFALKQPLNLDRLDDAQYSPVERAIVRALRDRKPVITPRTAAVSER